MRKQPKRKTKLALAKYREYILCVVFDDDSGWHIRISDGRIAVNEPFDRDGTAMRPYWISIGRFWDTVKRLKQGEIENVRSWSLA